MEIRHEDALIVVDLQNDFFSGGALPVNDADKVIAPINRLLRKFDHVFFTRDWHPLNHESFAEEPEFVDNSWPVHCTADSPGAEFHGDIHPPVDAVVVSKGVDPHKPGYSGFEDTILARELRRRKVDRVYICGLATDYCVKATALDAVREGLETYLLTDASRGVDFPSGNVKAALDAMAQGGVRMTDSREFN